MKRCVLLWLIVLALAVSATDSGASDIYYDDAVIEVTTSELHESTLGENILEVPYINSPKDSKGAASINAKIKDITSHYRTTVTEDTDASCTVLARPSTTEDYLNILIVGAIDPTALQFEDVYSFVYDKNTGKEITLEDAMTEDGLVNSDFEDSLAVWVKHEEALPKNKEYGKLTANNFTVEGFYMEEDGRRIYYLTSYVEFYEVQGDLQLLTYDDGTVSLVEL